MRPGQVEWVRCPEFPDRAFLRQCGVNVTPPWKERKGLRPPAQSTLSLFLPCALHALQFTRPSTPSPVLLRMVPQAPAPCQAESSSILRLPESAPGDPSHQWP